MRKSILLLLSLALVLITLPALGEISTREDAITVAQNFLAGEVGGQGEWAEFPSASILDCRPLAREGRDLAWYLTVEPQGYIIVSLIKELPAVKAYSKMAGFDPEAEVGMPALIKDSVAGTLDFLEENYGNLDNLPATVSAPSNRESWVRLVAGNQPRGDRDIVGPVMVNWWHQNAPLNNDCPMGDGGRTIVGCVATAASQIMHYWKYPKFGSGSHSYTWDGDQSCGGDVGGGTLFANFGDAYDWANIKNNYNSGYTSEEAAAVAELSYEVGVAFEMDYGRCGSGAWVFVGPDVYSGHFEFRSDIIEFINRMNYSQAEWWEIIKEELNHFPPRPMQYRIFSHSIVCDGYNEPANPPYYYHMNYGWGGSHNNWYALDDVYCPWTGCDINEEALIRGIEPVNFFNVTSPDGTDVWSHDDPIGAVLWNGCDATDVVLDLYQGEVFVVRISDWTPNDGSETPVGTVDPVWGTGADFRIRVVGDNNSFGWSAEFGIYGAGGWSDVTDGTLGDTGKGESVAWGDYDNDGWVDLYLSNDSQSNKLFGNTAGSFTDLSAAPVDMSGYSRGAAWGDFDNDGDLDLSVVQTYSNANALFRYDGSDVFADVTAGDLGDTSYSHDCVWGDYDNDGYLDFYVANVYAADRLFHNEGDGSFTWYNAVPVNDSGYGRSANWADYDNDGDLDIYLVKQSANRIHRNNGDGTFTNASPVPINDAGDGYGCAWADYDNDGDLDVYIVNNGANVLLRNDGGAVFTDVTASPLDNAGAGHGASWGDYDNDGRLDLYLANDGGNCLYHNEGFGVFAETTGPEVGDSGNGQGAAWADYDNDGDLDIYLANYETQNKLFRNDTPPTNHWLQVKLEGTNSNKQGIGAKVRVTVGGQHYYRTLGGDAGYLSQNMDILHFGLGSNDTIDNMRIYWPSGAMQDTVLVDVDQRVVIEESVSTAAGEEPIAADVRLFANYPNPFNPKTEIRFSLPEAAAVSLRVFDLSGRVVRELALNQTFGAGMHSMIWDGTDSQGRPVASGIFFYKLESSGFSQMNKMTLLK